MDVRKKMAKDTLTESEEEKSHLLNISAHTLQLLVIFITIKLHIHTHTRSSLQATGSQTVRCLMMPVFELGLDLCFTECQNHAQIYCSRNAAISHIHSGNE